MLAGTYFYYCTETSTKAKQVFRYRYLLNQNSHDESIGKQHHPIFMMISPNALSFYFNPDVSPESSHLLQLFSIPLYPKDSKLDKLTASIISLCDEKGIERKSNNLKTNEPIFNNEDAYIIHYDGNINNVKNDVLKYWVIFQHFLYDLSFSSVFRSASAYEEAIIRLRENYFVNCIIAKSEYRFWADKYIKKKNQSNKYIQDKFWEADKNWVHLIVEEKNNQVLEVSHNWFQGAEKELKEVLLKKPGRKQLLNSSLAARKNSKPASEGKKKEAENLRKEIKMQRDNIYHFFLHRFNAIAIECYVFRYNPVTYLVSLAFLLGVLIWFASLQNNIVISAILLLASIGTWQGILRPFFFIISNMLRSHINYYNHSLAYPRMSLAIVAIWLGYIPVCEEAWAINITFSDKVFFVLLLAFLLVVFVSIFYFVNDVQYGRTRFSTAGMIAGYKSLILFFKGMTISIAFGLFSMEASRENIFDTPSDFFPKEVGIFKVDSLTKIQDSIELELSTQKNADTIGVLYNYAKHLHLHDIIPDTSHIDTTKTKEILDSLAMFKLKAIADLAKEHGKKKNLTRIPSIATFKIGKWDFFIFPKLLLTYSAFAFFIGLFAQVAFQGSNYRENL